MNVSAIIINYNLGRFFEDAYKSLRKQTRLPDELIIVDDCSTDNSIQIIENVLSKYPGKFPSTVIRHDQNLGASSARNTGIQASKHEVVALLDGDDFYYKNKIEKSMNYLEKFQNQVAMVYSDYDMWDGNTPKREFKFSYDSELMMQTCLPNSDSLIAKNIFEQVGYFNPQIHGAEDYDMWMRIAKEAMVIHIPEALFCYRIHGDNFTIRQRNQVLTNTQRLLNAK